MALFISAGLALLFALAPLLAAKADYAVAYGNSGKRWAFGTSYNSATLDAARKHALDACNAKACRIVLSGRGQCAAVAVGAQNNTVGWIAAETLAEAREGALVACSEAGRRCVIKASFCDASSGRAADTPSSGVPVLTTTPAPALPDDDARTYDTFVRALKSRLRSCASLSGAGFAGSDTVRLVLSIDDEGGLVFPPRISTVGSGGNAGAFATRLVIALNRCAPYSALPGVKTYTWNNISIDFTPEDFR